MSVKTLIVITGPTGVGKTDAAIAVAKHLGCDIINADSRQVYRGIPIGTAAPTAQQLAAVRHHFVAIKNLDEYYSAAQYEADVLSLLPELDSDMAVMCGGSMLYVDAVCNGIDELPTITAQVRASIASRLETEGVETLLADLQRLDPEYYEQVDKHNIRRVVHAVEICLQAGAPYSSLRTGAKKQRPFRIVKVGLNIARPALFQRINSRVDEMMRLGLEQEARGVYALRHLNSLNTVGYKEMFAYFDGTMDYSTAVERIKKNTRVYAKKQLTWFKRDASVVWCEPSHALDAVLSLLAKT